MAEILSFLLLRLHFEQITCMVLQYPEYNTYAYVTDFL